MAAFLIVGPKFLPLKANCGCTVAYMPLTLDEKLNRTVRHQFAANAQEVAEVVALLPVKVASELTQELERCGEAHRYDVSSERAYSFRSEGNTLTIWTWKDVDASEAGNLLPLIVNLNQSVSEDVANDAFFRATGRRVGEPRTYRRPDQWYVRFSADEVVVLHD